MQRIALALGLVSACLVPGCQGDRPVDPRARFPIPVQGASYDRPDAELPRLEFPDGTRTENDRCMILERKLNPKIPPIWVNDTPVGFC
jgi:hypothetical protein